MTVVVAPWVGALLAVASLPFVLAAAYLALLAAWSRRLLPRAAGSSVRFDIIVPAHDEESGIVATIESLFAIAYPRDRFRVTVIADNCSDATAARARGAGARVLERADATRRGKGHALGFAYEAVLAQRFADAVVVIDADTLVSANLLSEFAALLGTGAEAIQAAYGVRNASATWRTRLMHIAFTLFHDVRSLGRERLGLSCGLRGNGMCFSRDLLRRVPPSAHSIVEDVEQGIQLGLAGVRIHYAADAEVLGEMPEDALAARSQRERWEGGRLALARRHVPALLRAAIGRRDRVTLDLAVDLLVPPLSILVGLTLLGACVALLAGRAGAGASSLVGWLIAAAGICTYVGRGVVLSGAGLGAIVDLAWTPVYMIWKLTLLKPFRPRSDSWVRTTRNSSVMERDGD